MDEPKPKKLSRRDFLKIAGVGIGGTAIAATTGYKLTRFGDPQTPADQLFSAKATQMVEQNITNDFTPEREFTSEVFARARELTWFCHTELDRPIVHHGKAFTTWQSTCFVIMRDNVQYLIQPGHGYYNIDAGKAEATNANPSQITLIRPGIDTQPFRIESEQKTIKTVDYKYGVDLAVTKIPNWLFIDPTALYLDNAEINLNNQYLNVGFPSQYLGLEDHKLNISTLNLVHGEIVTPLMVNKGAVLFSGNTAQGLSGSPIFAVDQKGSLTVMAVATMEHDPQQSWRNFPDLRVKNTFAATKLQIDNLINQLG